MARHFHPRSNHIARVLVLGAPLLAGLIGFCIWQLQQSPYATAQDVYVDQPVPFSHEHHVKGLGVDCRYCHTSVSDSSFAGIPPTKTCMTCHSQLWTNAGLLQPVRDSWQQDKPIQWNRVHRLPDYVFFNHEIHVNKGVGCSTCHGPVDEMPLMRQHSTLQMGWCLDCHRNPEKNLRPRDEAFNMKYTFPANQAEVGKDLAERYHVRSVRELTDCTTCHR